MIYKNVGKVKEIRDGATSHCWPQQDAIATPGLKVRKLEPLLEPSTGPLARSCAIQ